MPVPPSDELIEQFLAGELEPDVARHVREYLDATPSRRGIMAGIRASIRGETFARAPELDAALARFHTLVDRVGAQPQAGTPGRRDGISPIRRGVSGNAPSGSSITVPMRSVVRISATIAAGLLVCIGLAGVLRKRTSHTSPMTVAAKVYRTANAQRATVLLPDGSTVVLGPASTLAMSPEFGAQQREVTVQGEGYFIVRADAQRPFLVHAGNSLTRVLGTAFTIRHYATDRDLRVAVVNGRVLLRALGHSVSRGEILPAGTLGVVDSAGEIDATSQAAIEDYTAWTKGQLIFHGTPLRDVLVEVERQYDLTLQFADTTQLEKGFNAQFTDEPVGQVLDAIGLAFHARYTRSGPNGRIVKFISASPEIQHIVPARLPHSSTQDTQYGR